jgi:hypothetical protein
MSPFRRRSAINDIRGPHLARGTTLSLQAMAPTGRRRGSELGRLREERLGTGVYALAPPHRQKAFEPFRESLGSESG